MLFSACAPSSLPSSPAELEEKLSDHPHCVFSLLSLPHPVTTSLPIGTPAHITNTTCGCRGAEVIGTSSETDQTCLQNRSETISCGDMTTESATEEVVSASFAAVCKGQRSLLFCWTCTQCRTIS